MCRSPEETPEPEPEIKVERTPAELKLISEAAEAAEIIPEDELEDFAQRLRNGGVL